MALANLSIPGEACAKSGSTPQRASLTACRQYRCRVSVIGFIRRAIRRSVRTTWPARRAGRTVHSGAQKSGRTAVRCAPAFEPSLRDTTNRVRGRHSDRATAGPALLRRDRSRARPTAGGAASPYRAPDRRNAGRRVPSAQTRPRVLLPLRRDSRRGRPRVRTTGPGHTGQQWETRVRHWARRCRARRRASASLRWSQPTCSWS